MKLKQNYKWLAISGLAALTTFLVVWIWTVLVAPFPSLASVPSEHVVDILHDDKYCQRADYVYQKLASEISSMDFCSSDADCVVVEHPVGCYTTINRAKKDEYTELTQALARDLENAHSRCSVPMAKCAQTYPPTCLGGRCSIWHKPEVDLNRLPTLDD